MGIFAKTNKKGKKIWYIDYYVEGRRVRERIGEIKTQAKAALAKRMGDIVTGKYELKKAAKSPRFDRFCDDYLEWAKLNKKSWQRDNYSILELKKYFGAKRLSEISVWAIESYKQKRMHTRNRRGSFPAPATVNRELACLKKMFSLAAKWDKTTGNPVKSVALMREREAGRRLTALEKHQLINACNSHLRPIVIFALNTGKRLSEILNLRWSDVNFDTWHITIRESKSGDSWTIPVNSVVQELLQSLPKSPEWVFPNRKGGRLKSIKDGWYAAVKRSKISHCRFHDLRHTWASEMGEHTDLKTLMKLGGWKTADIPMRYIHPTVSYERDALEKLAEKNSQAKREKY